MCCYFSCFWLFLVFAFCLHFDLNFKPWVVASLCIPLREVSYHCFPLLSPPFPSPFIFLPVHTSRMHVPRCCHRQWTQLLWATDEFLPFLNFFCSVADTAPLRWLCWAASPLSLPSFLLSHLPLCPTTTPLTRCCRVVLLVITETGIPVVWIQVNFFHLVVWS